MPADSRRSIHHRIARLGSLPVAIAIMVALNGLYVLLIAFGNITDFGTNQPFVQHVLSMDTTNFGAPAGTNLDPDVMWRSIDNSSIQNIAYIGLIVWECLTALVLLAAFVVWVRERGTGFVVARPLSTIGLVMVVMLFFGGFISVGGEWFQMWKSTAWNGLDPAFRNAVLALGALILVHLPSSHWDVEA